MKNIIDSWLNRVRRLKNQSVSLTSICKDLKIRYTVIGKWKKRLPRSVRIYNQIVRTIEAMEQIDPWINKDGSPVFEMDLWVKDGFYTRIESVAYLLQYKGAVLFCTRTNPIERHSWEVYHFETGLKLGVGMCKGSAVGYAKSTIDELWLDNNGFVRCPTDAKVINELLGFPSFD